MYNIKDTRDSSWHMKILLLFLTGIPLVLGGIIYLSYREDVFVISRLGHFFINTGFLNEFKHLLVQKINIPSVLVYSLPSGLWVFSTTLLSSRVRLKGKSCFIVLMSTPLLYSLLLEVSQFYNITDGTFDAMDVLYSCLGWVAAVLLSYFYDQLARSSYVPIGLIVLSYCILILGNVY